MRLVDGHVRLQGEGIPLLPHEREVILSPDDLDNETGSSLARFRGGLRENVAGRKVSTGVGPRVSTRGGPKVSTGVGLRVSMGVGPVEVVFVCCHKTPHSCVWRTGCGSFA